MIAFEAWASRTSDSVTLPVPTWRTWTLTLSVERRSRDSRIGSTEPWTSVLRMMLRSLTSPAPMPVEMSSRVVRSAGREAPRPAGAWPRPGPSRARSARR